MDQKSSFGEQMPASIGRYQVQGSIGFGAMGAVYKAFDPLIKRTLAIKTIRLDIPRNSPQYKSFIERFYHEARISGTLSHPHIVTLFDIGEEHAIPYLAMEFVEGDTLSSLLEKGVKFPPERVIGLVSQVASAIDYAHTKGVIHRDIKPSNMILSEDRLKVTDFGIAKLVDSDMTQSGQLLGTPSYMSPEQAMGDKLDGRSDIFSLGVCAFEMLSGEQPFPGTNVTSILYKLVHVDPIEPASLEMQGLVPQKWHEVFSKVLAKKPDDRYQTGAEFVQDLEYCLGSWFGAMGSDSVSDVSATVAIPAVIPAPSLVEITAAIARDEVIPPPEGPPTIRPSATLPSAAPRASIELTAPMPRVSVPGPAEEESPMTVQMKAPKLEDLKTTPMPVPAPVAPPPEEDYGTVAMKAPFAPTQRESPDATVTVKASPPAASIPRPAPAPSAPPTLPPLPQTIRQPAPVLDAPTIRPGAAKAAAPSSVLTPPPVARSGISPLLVLGLAGGFFFLAILIAVIVWVRQHGATAASPTPAPVVEATPISTLPTVTTAPPAAVTGSLHVETLPPGANILVNGEPRGTSPLDLTSLTIGNYEVRAELRGYNPAAETATIIAEAPNVPLKLTLVRTAPTQGSLEISSDPPGSAVFVDGNPAGETPVADLRLKPGSHRVEVTLEGYEPWSGSVTIEAGKKARLEAPLTLIPKATPTPAPPQLDTAKVYLNTASDVDQIAKRVSGSSASYPSNAPRLKSGDSVSVSINFVVDEKGEVVDPKVVESAGKQIDDAVLSAVRAWKYQPATKQGTPVKVKVTFKQTFRTG